VHVRQLRPDFGAEIVDFDIHSGVAAAEAEQLRAALDQHQLLLLRSEHAIRPERQVEICSGFGPIMNNGKGSWSVLKNDEASGRIRLPFHSDFSYSDCPIKLISLHATDIPAGGTSTSFVSGACAWASLPGDLKAQLSTLSLRHRHVSSLGTDWPEFFADHPVCKPHPRTGRPILFVTEHHADRILELAPDASQALLDRLFAHLYAPAHVYTHRWRLHDLLIWDNWALQHGRPEVADPANGKRAMQRVAVNEVNVPELVARARRAQRLPA
jgi:taurine dioxygenase